MARSNFGRPGLFAPRNLVAIGAVVVVVLGAFLLLRTFGTPAPPPAAPEVAEAQAPVPEPAPEPPPTLEAPAQEEQPPAPTYPLVLVASQEIRPGVLLTPEMVAWQEWTEPLDVEVAVVKDMVDEREVRGAVALQTIPQGSMVALDVLIRPGQPAFIAAVLKPGHRAVTVEVDAATTAAKIIYPGHRVDVIMVLDGSKFAEVGPAAQVLVRDVRVLAVGSSSLEIGRLTGPGSAFGPSATPPEGKTYTLEVTPVDAERLVLGAANGRLSLAMRSIAQLAGEPGPGARVTRLGEVLRLPRAPAQTAEPEPTPPVVPPKVRVIRGGVRRSETETVATPPSPTSDGTAEVATRRPA